MDSFAAMGLNESKCHNKAIELHQNKRSLPHSIHLRKASYEAVNSSYGSIKYIKFSVTSSYLSTMIQVLKGSLVKHEFENDCIN